MRIGFDAKRAFFNRSGLGNYSRDLILALHRYYSDNEYYLYTPSLKNHINFIDSDNIYIRTPTGRPGKLGQAFWRSFRIARRAEIDGIEIFHGLSNELPRHVKRTGIKSVVTIHDLIFMHHPEWYKSIDVAIYKRKCRDSSRQADRVIAVSEQTKKDLIAFFNIEQSKIEIIYQGCNAAFTKVLDEAEKRKVKEKWALPDEYLLYVGTIEERKNLLTILKAISSMNIDIPLVVVGRKTRYYRQIIKYMDQHKLKNIMFLEEVSVHDLPGIYQMANVFIYPSIFEGFGIPILEALYSKVPVITSKGGCFAEVGGPESVYVDPGNNEELGNAISQILNNSVLQQKMKSDGYKHALQFSSEVTAHRVMELYNRLLNE